MKNILYSKSVKVIGEESEVGDGTSAKTKFDMSLMFLAFFRKLYHGAFKTSAENDRSRPKKYYSNLNFFFKKQFFCVIVGMHLSAILEVLDYGSFQEMFKVLVSFDPKFEHFLEATII